MSLLDKMSVINTDFQKYVSSLQDQFWGEFDSLKTWKERDLVFRELYSRHELWWLADCRKCEQALLRHAKERKFGAETWVE